MSDMHAASDDPLYDRLVDGELTADQRRSLLATLDDRPDGWRRCALAFLEAQAWAEQFDSIVNQRSAPAVVSAGASQKKRRCLASWLAVAASLVVAFTLGLVLRSGPAIEDVPTGQANVVAMDPPEAGPASELPVPGADDGNALTLWVRDQQGQVQPLSVPLLAADELDRQLGTQFRSNIPDDVRRQLQQQGYRVESRRHYAPLWLDQGQPLVVPVEDTQIVPVSRHVY